MKSTREIISQVTDGIKLKILVFGPQVDTPSNIQEERDLQNKRAEIKENLIADGHYVKFGEELTDPDLPYPFNNLVFQEDVLMQEYDLIVTLVGSLGSAGEASMISRKPNLAIKASLFLDEKHIGTYIHSTCVLAQDLGATFNTYVYPDDLTQCHLLGFVKEKVNKVKLAKYYS